MADIELVVKIDEKDYQLMKDGHIPFNVLDGIRNAIQLPKGHGRLIDINTLTFEVKGGDTILVDAPTAIEADTETWNSCHGQVTVPKGTMKKIYEDGDIDDNTSV